MPIDRHAIAKPCAWLPADEHTTPAAISSADSCRSRLLAPRSLYERTAWRSSRFRYTVAPTASESRSLSCNGVRVTTSEIRRAAASMSAADTGGDVRALWLRSADTDQW